MARTPFFGRGPGPQIARMDMQSATAPGRAYGKMFESLGESAGQAIETFSKNKQRSEALDGQIGAILMNMSPEQRDQLENNPIGKTLEKFVKQDLSLSGKESLLGGLLVDQKMDAQKRQRDQQDYLWEKQKATDDATKRFIERSMGMIPNPEVEKIDAKIAQEQQGLNRVMTTPPTIGKSGIPGPSQDHLVGAFEQRIKNLKESKGEYDSQIPMLNADASTFYRNYGTPLSSEEAMIVRNELIRRETRGDSLAGKSFDSLSKRLQVEDTLASREGDQFVADYSPPKYYFNRSEASGSILADARAKGITLDKEQLEMAMSVVTVVDTKDLRAQAEKQFREKKVTETISILNAANDLEAFIEEGGPLSAQVAKEKLARMVQPTGILTEDDLSRMGQSKGMVDRIFTKLEELKTGELDEDLKRYLLETTAVFRDLASKELTKRTDQSLDYLSKTFKITPDEARQYTQFGQVLENLPGVPGSQSGSGSPPSVAPGNQTLPGGGLFAPVPPR